MIAGVGRKRVLRWGILLLSAILPLLVARKQFLTGDPTDYLGLAVSMAGGDGYHVMGEPHTHFPPGLPLLLLPIALAFGQNVLLAQLSVALFAPLSLLAVLFFLRKFDPSTELPVGFLLVLSFTFFVLATEGIRSELPYLAASAFALAILVRRKPDGEGSPGLGILTAALSSAVVLLRVIGVALPLALLATWAQRRFRREPQGDLDGPLLAGGVAGLLTFGAWSTWTTAKGGSSYLDLFVLRSPHQPDLGMAELSSILARIPGAALTQITYLATLSTGTGWLRPLWLSPITLLLVLLLGLGLWRELSRSNPVVAWYLLGYGAILGLWPFDEGSRFVLPVFPLALAIAWRGGRYLIDVTPKSREERDSGRHSCASNPWRARWVWLGLGVTGLTVGGLGLAGLGEFATPSRQSMVIAFLWLLVGGGSIALGFRRPFVSLSLVLSILLPLYLTGYGLINLSRIVPKAISNTRGEIVGASAAMEPGVAWLMGHAAPGEVVMAEFASSVHFYTGLTVEPLPVTGDPDVLQEALRTSGATYLFINDPPEYPYYLPTEIERFRLLQDREGAGRFEPVYRFPAGTIYRIRTSPPDESRTPRP